MTVATTEYDAKISAVLKQLMEWRGDTNETIAPVIGCTAQTVGRKRRGERGWAAGEVGLLAAHYGVSEDMFYRGADVLFRRPGDSPPTTEGSWGESIPSFPAAACFTLTPDPAGASPSIRWMRSAEAGVQTGSALGACDAPSSATALSLDDPPHAARSGRRIRAARVRFMVGHIGTRRDMLSAEPLTRGSGPAARPP